MEKRIVEWTGKIIAGVLCLAFLASGLIFIAQPVKAETCEIGFGYVGEAEPNNDKSNAMEVYAGDIVIGYLNEKSDVEDWYKIWIEEDASVTFNLYDPSGSDFDLYLYNGTDAQIDYSILVNSYDEVSNRSDDFGYLYLKVRAFAGTGIYKLVVHTNYDVYYYSPVAGYLAAIKSYDSNNILQDELLLSSYTHTQTWTPGGTSADKPTYNVGDKWSYGAVEYNTNVLAGETNLAAQASMNYTHEIIGTENVGGENCYVRLLKGSYSFYAGLGDMGADMSMQTEGMRWERSSDLKVAKEWERLDQYTNVTMMGSTTSTILGSNVSCTWTPAFENFAFPLTVGKAWNTTYTMNINIELTQKTVIDGVEMSNMVLGSGTQSGQITIYSKVVRKETITTPAGELECFVIHQIAGRPPATAGAPDFMLAANPEEVSITKGSASTVTLSLIGVNGLTGAVSLSASGSGVTTSLSSSSVSLTPSAQAVLTISVPSTATTGTTTVTVTGSAAGKTHTATIKVNILADEDFELEAFPETIPIARESASGTWISAVPINGFSGSVSLSVEGTIQGVTFTFVPSSVSPLVPSLLTITASNTAAVGNHNVKVVGTSGSKTHSINITINVIDTPDFIMYPSEEFAYMGASQTTTFKVYFQAFRGFNSQVRVLTEVVPYNPSITVSVSPSTITPNADGSAYVTVTVNTGATVIDNIYSIIVTGAGGNVERNTMFTLLATSLPGFFMNVLKENITVEASGYGEFPIEFGAVNGYSSSLNLHATVIPAEPTITTTFVQGVTVTPTSAKVTNTLKVQTTSTTPAGKYTIQVNATASGRSGESAVATMDFYVKGGSASTSDFSISALESTLTIPAGVAGEGTIGIKCTPIGNFNSQVSFSASASPSNSGISFTFTPTSISDGNGTTTLKVTTTSAVPAGNYTITVSGTSGSTTKTCTFTLKISTEPDFTMSLDKTSSSIKPGEMVEIILTVNAINGFTGNIGITLSVSPTNDVISSKAEPSVITNSGTSQITLSAANDAQKGTYTLTITGTASSITHSKTFSLEILEKSETSTPGTNNLMLYAIIGAVILVVVVVVVMLMMRKGGKPSQVQMTQQPQQPQEYQPQQNQNQGMNPPQYQQQPQEQNIQQNMQQPPQQIQ